MTRKHWWLAMTVALCSVPAQAQAIANSSVSGAAATQAGPTTAPAPSTFSTGAVPQYPNRNSVAVSPTAVGRTNPAIPTQQTKTKRRLYGWQTLAVDAGSLLVAVAAMAGGSGNQSPALGLVAAGGYVLGGPIVHLAHGHPGKAGLSLGLRVGLPLTALVLVGALSSCPSGNDGEACNNRTFVNSLTAAGATVLLASIIDAAAIARETVNLDPPIGPTLQVGKDGGWVGVAGRF